MRDGQGLAPEPGELLLLGSLAIWFPGVARWRMGRQFMLVVD